MSLSCAAIFAISAALNSIRGQIRDVSHIYHAPRVINLAGILKHSTAV